MESGRLAEGRKQNELLGKKPIETGAEFINFLCLLSASVVGIHSLLS